jgi:ParB family chromosome partitioning protein
VNQGAVTDCIDPADVRIGARHRKTLPRLDALAASIDELGLLHPIVVTPSGELIAGARRHAAWALTRFAGQPIPCRVVDLVEIVQGEAAENFQREPFTLSEAVAIKRALAPLEAAKAKERQRKHGGTAPGRKHSGQIAHSDPGRAGDKVAKAAGISRRTLDKAAAVVEAAESDPEQFGRLVAAMDRTGARHEAPRRAGARVRPSPGRPPRRRRPDRVRRRADIRRRGR